jgi:hypothetical protein
VYSQSFSFPRKHKRNTCFSEHLVFSPEKLGFLRSHQGYSQRFGRKPSFKLGFCLVLEKQAIVWFSAGCLHLLQLTKWKYSYISFNICVEYSKEDLQTQRLYIDCARKSVI